MVLAEGTAQIAAEAAHREDQTAGMEPAQGLFLDGIQGQAGQLSIVQQHNSSIPADPGPAEAGLAFFQMAMVEAQLTGYAHVCRTTSNRSRV